ncbi:MAG: hypothetical protein ACLGH8_10350 [Bacteroidia bacterium]
MKKSTKKILKVISIIIGGLAVFITTLFFCNVRLCGNYSKTYFEWLPYAETDAVTFVNGTQDLVFTVKSARKNHITLYNKNCKCGTCEDDFTVDLVSHEGEISVHAINYNIDAEAKTGIHVFIFGQTFEDDNLFPENGTQVIAGNVYIQKGKGITQFSYKGKVWKLKQHKKLGTEPQVKTNSNT